jgi:hypothetical protein
MSAIFSVCGGDRYRLEREIHATGVVVASCGVDLSRADQAFAASPIRSEPASHTAGAVTSTSPATCLLAAPRVEDLVAVVDPIGPDNDAHIGQIINDAELPVRCWGRPQEAADPVAGSRV